MASFESKYYDEISNSVTQPGKITFCILVAHKCYGNKRIIVNKKIKLLKITSTNFNIKYLTVRVG